MGENPVNPAPTGVPNTSDANNLSVPNVDPAMPNAMGVTMDPSAGGAPAVDPNVAPNPFDKPAASAAPAGVGTASVLPNPGVTAPSMNVPKPEVVTGSSGGGNKPWVVLGVLAVVVIIGMLGAFAYFSLVAVAPVQVSPSPAPVTEASPSALPTPRAMTIEEKIAIEEGSLNDLQSSLNAADKGLSDKQGDLSE